jgi:hypothetical protein
VSAIELAVRLTFVPAGQVVLDESGRPRFPALPTQTAVYRLTFTGVGPDRVYIGETDNTRRRGQNYRTPGPSQRTSLRINALLCDHLAAGGTVAVATASTAEVIRDGRPALLDLAIKAGRVLAEHAALVTATLDGERVLNL